MERPPQPAEGYEATVTSAIARRGVEINTSDVHANVSRATARQSPSLVTSTMAMNFPDDDEVCAWIWRSSRMARLGGNVSRATARQSPSLNTYTMAMNFPDDDEVCAWIWRSSRMARLGGEES